jgi:hypothetical protein
MTTDEAIKTGLNLISGSAYIYFNLIEVEGGGYPVFR